MADFESPKVKKELAYLFDLNLLMSTGRNRILSGLFLLALILCSSWVIHKFYVSLTEIRYNQDRERFEISIRIFPDDLDRALLERTGIYTQLATELEHRDADSLLMLYLLEDLTLEVNGTKLALDFLGKEPESNAIWCYLESTKVATPGTITVHNSILTEYFPEQVNIIQVYRGKWNKGLLLDRDQMTGSLILGE